MCKASSVELGCLRKEDLKSKGVKPTVGRLIHILKEESLMGQSGLEHAMTQIVS